MIKIKHLSKSFGKKIIFDDVSIDIKPGKVGIIGVNGAGKTTLANCISELTRYSGVIETYKRIGYCFSENILPDYVSIFEIANTLNWDINKLDKYLNLLYATEYKFEMIKNLSYGNAKKMNIIATLFLDNDLIIFDELTNGLDVNAQINLIDVLVNDPRDILLISHDFNILSKVCSSYVLVDDCDVKYIDVKKNDLEQYITSIVKVSDEK